MALVLTGPSGSGKSTLARWLAGRGWELLDGDALARSLYRPGSALLKRVAHAFGAGVLKPDGSLDRAALARLAFASRTRRRRLTALVYPAFWRLVRARLKAARRRPLAADLAVYFDAGAPRLDAKVVLVSAPLATRVARLRAKGLTAARGRAQARSLSFGPRERRQADLVLDGRQPRARLRAKLTSFLDLHGHPSL